MARLFLALWPPGPAREALGALARRVAAETGGRAVPAANLHLTLAFLGEVDPVRESRIPAAVEGIDAPAFELTLERLGAFPKTGVAWAGCASVPSALASLQAQIDARLREAGFDLERRAFAPHLTLARRITQPPGRRDIDAVSWRVEAFSLVESAREKGGYRERAAWRLRQ